MQQIAATKLGRAQCERAMRDGEFGDDVIKAGPRVVVVLTQSWCPQWDMTMSWLDDAAREAGAAVFYLEYDKETFFEPFMAWKEDVLGNRSVPYLRYYRDGALVAQTNYVSRAVFTAMMNREARRGG